MKRPVISAEVARQRAKAVRIAYREIGMPAELLDALNRVYPLRDGLQCEPLVEH